jgi:hypothetical protein
MSNLRGAWQPALAALLGSALMLWLAWPGFYTFDSIDQLAQVRGLVRLGDEHPPLMVLIWRLLDRIWPNPGGMFALLVAGYWSALAILVWNLFDGAARRWLVFCLVGLWPPAFIVICHVWKDGATAAALLAACASIASWHRSGRRGSTVFAALWLIVAACLRHNAILAAAPLALWLAWPRTTGDAQRRPARGVALRTSAIALLTCVAMAIAPPLLARAAGARPGHVWTIVALWDLAGISVHENRVLIPPSDIIGTLSVDDLRRGYTPYSAGPLFELGKIRLSYDMDFSPAELASLRSAWLHAVGDYPASYLRHRMAFSRYQFLGYPRDAIRDLTFAPMRFEFPGFPLHLPPVDTGAPWLRMLEWLRPTPLFAGALYVGLAMLAAFVAWRRRQSPDPSPALALSFSSLANALPLLIISGSADFRYMIWSVLASLLALALALQPAAREDGIQP